MPVRDHVWILFADDCDCLGLSMLEDSVALGTEVVSFVRTTLSCRRFLRTCPLGVSTMYISLFWLCVPVSLYMKE